TSPLTLGTLSPLLILAPGRALMPHAEQRDPTARRDALAARLLDATLGLMDLAAIHIGDRLGLYRSLARRGPMTSAQLAAETRAGERYVREWLEQQAVGGFLEVDDPAQPADARRYALPDGHAEV